MTKCYRSLTEFPLLLPLVEPYGQHVVCGLREEEGDPRKSYSTITILSFLYFEFDFVLNFAD